MCEQREGGMSRRVFLGGLASLGVLATLYFLIPAFLRRGKKVSEPVLLAAASPPPPPVESVAPVLAEKAETTSSIASHSPVAILYREELKEYNFGSGKPYQGKRYGAFFQYVQGHLPENNYRTFEAELATDDDLLLLADPEYVDFNKQFFRTGGPDWPVNEEFLKYHSHDNKPHRGAGQIHRGARLLVGQAKKAADLVQAGEIKKAVSVGGGAHHAFRKHGEGFSIYNDVTFCALHLMKQYGLDKILILDTDAHAGNGTSSYFYDDPRVLFIDLHQDPKTLYPGTGFVDEIGTGAGTGYTMNIPLPPEADYRCYRLAFESIVEPVTQEFQPQIIIWNGGADPHSVDPMTNLGLRTGDFQKLGTRVRQMAEICDGKAITFLMSGYAPDILPLAWFRSVVGLGGFERDEEESQAVQESLSAVILHSKTEEILNRLKTRVRHYWKNLV